MSDELSFKLNEHAGFQAYDWNKEYLRVSPEGEILHREPNAKEWPVNIRPIGLMLERLFNHLTPSACFIRSSWLIFVALAHLRDHSLISISHANVPMTFRASSPLEFRSLHTSSCFQSVNMPSRNIRSWLMTHPHHKSAASSPCHIGEKHTRCRLTYASSRESGMAAVL